MCYQCRQAAERSRARQAELLLPYLFDIAVGSNGFMSGFLDDEEVAKLREAAVLLGRDPEVATPPEFRCKYAGRHVGVVPGPVCSACRQIWTSTPWVTSARLE